MRETDFGAMINSLSLLLVLLLLVLLFLIMKPSVEEIKCENLCEASAYEFSTVEIYVLHYIIQYFMISAHWAVPVHSSQLLNAIYISCWLVFKRHISRTMTSCLYLANAFVDKYGKTTTAFTQLLCATEGANRIINECHLFFLT